MIGGYLYRDLDADLDARLRRRLGERDTRIDIGNHGYLFHDRASGGRAPALLVSDGLVALSDDLLVRADPGGEYRHVDLASDFAPLFARNEAAALDGIDSDYRLAVVRRTDGGVRLSLVSNRAGSGRLYYHATASGVVFSSDLRFLLQVVPCRVDPLAVYAILKYGAAPDPLTISAGVRSVPPAHYVERDLLTGSERSAPYFRLRFGCDAAGAAARGAEESLGPAREALRRSARFLAAERPAILLSGGIDSSLYGTYLGEASGDPLRGFYCAFGEHDPELPYAEEIAKRLDADLHIARMGREDAIGVLRDVVRWTDHPFSDFSSLPITFLLKQVRERMGEGALLVECNGGDDCFGFPDLGNESKFRAKHRFPRVLKRLIALALGRTALWKWESRGGIPARLAALADTHERRLLDYFLVLAPVAYLGLRGARESDVALSDAMEEVFARCAENPDALGYEAATTVRQLLHVNSRRWAAKALSVGESLGLRVVYPFIWREVLRAQGEIPWSAKIRDGVVKWPLKRLLEATMPASFIHRKKSGFVPPFATWLTDPEFNATVRRVLLDRDAVNALVVPRKVWTGLLDDAARGRRLKHSILNFLWGALFLELWIREHAT